MKSVLYVPLFTVCLRMKKKRVNLTLTTLAYDVIPTTEKKTCAIFVLSNWMLFEVSLRYQVLDFILCVFGYIF